MISKNTNAPFDPFALPTPTPTNRELPPNVSHEDSCSFERCTLSPGRLNSNCSLPEFEVLRLLSSLKPSVPTGPECPQPATFVHSSTRDIQVFSTVFDVSVRPAPSTYF